MMTAYDCASEYWLDRAESATGLRATELAQFRQDNPPPRLAEFMKGTF